MTFNDPTLESFKLRFNRDFPFGEDEDKVQDQDITRALSDCKARIASTKLLSTQEEWTYAFLLLSAHFLVVNLRNSSQGLSGRFDFLESSKSIGGISVSSTVPEAFTKDPFLNSLSRSSYGGEYLSYVYSKSRGALRVVEGTTTYG